jgi:hypothetical protein
MDTGHFEIPFRLEDLCNVIPTQGHFLDLLSVLVLEGLSANNFLDRIILSRVA